MHPLGDVALSDRFAEALRLAFELHRSQRRKVSGEPYLSHLLGVCAIVLAYGGDEDAAIAALLHDAAEDQGGQATLAEIGRRFGEAVAATVEGCSDTLETPKPPWRQRKEAHLNRMATASADVLLVMAADKLDNARALRRELVRRGESVWAFFRGGHEGTLWYYRAMVTALQAALDRAPRGEQPSGTGDDPSAPDQKELPAAQRHRLLGELVAELDRAVAELEGHGAAS
mgnify:CR=1 FL=1